MTVGPGHFAVLGALIIAIGAFGVMAHRNGFALVLSLGVMFLGPVIALVGFSELGAGAEQPAKGSAFALLAMVSVGAQALVAVAMLTLAWRRRESIDVDDMHDLSA